MNSSDLNVWATEAEVGHMSEGTPQVKPVRWGRHLLAGCLTLALLTLIGSGGWL
jgi:hypothetical protein